MADYSQYNTSDSWRTKPPYNQSSEMSDIKRNNKNTSNTNISTKYTATCQCSRVTYVVMDDPLDSKLCHCRDCQKLHGAPFEWVSIFRKTDVRFLSGLDQLYFWSDELGRGFEAEERDKLEINEVKSCDNGLGKLYEYKIGKFRYFVN